MYTSSFQTFKIVIHKKEMKLLFCSMDVVICAQYQNAIIILTL